MSNDRIGLVVSTAGRESRLKALLRSASSGRVTPHAVVVANQSGRRLELGDGYPFHLEVIDSCGGASAGRNDSWERLRDEVDYVGTPNDDSRFEEGTLAAVVRAFDEFDSACAIAVTLWEANRARFLLPRHGTVLDRRTVWRAICPGLFFATRAVDQSRPFNPSLGPGSPSPWRSGEETELLLRIMERGGRVVSAPSIRVLGAGEHRDLTEKEFVRKVWAYARGTGYVYKLRDYRAWQKAGLVIAPWIRWALSGEGSHGSPPLLADGHLSRGRIALATSLGRYEGLRGRPLVRVVEYPTR